MALLLRLWGATFFSHGGIDRRNASVSRMNQISTTLGLTRPPTPFNSKLPTHTAFLVIKRSLRVTHCLARIGEQTKQALRRRLLSVHVRTSSLCSQYYPAVRCSPVPAKARRTSCTATDPPNSRKVARSTPVI